MRKRITAMLVAVAMVLCMMPMVSLAAEGETPDDGMLTYVELADGTLSVTGLSSTFSGSAVNIPSAVSDKAVTAIKNDAFRSNATIQSATIPSSIKSIGEDAFYNCSNLSSVSFSEGLRDIGLSAFNDCDALESITIPASVMSIGHFAFSNCDRLSSMTFINGCKAIEPCICVDCDALESVTIPASVTSIGDLAFNDCDALESVTIPASVMSIGKYVFSSCGELSNVMLNEGLKEIGSYSFQNCSALTSISIPSSVTKICSSAFLYCSNLSSVTLYEGLNVIEINSFFGCDSLTTITIPSTVAEIDEYAFSGCEKLRKAVILSRIAHIDENFAGTDIKSDGIYGYAGSTAQSYATANGIPFHAFQATISVSANNAAYGTVSGSGAYNIDGSATVSAAPKSGYHFVRWTESGAQVSTSADYTFTVTADRSLMAVFEQDAPVTPPAPAVIPVGVTCTKTDATLYGTANGSITVSASGGNSGRYEYSLNSGAWQSGNVFSSVAAGTYTVTVRDAGNIGNTAACRVSIGQPPSVGNIPAKKIPSKENAGTAMTIVPPAAPKGYTTTSVTYSSSNPAIATVDASGNVTFLTGGKVTIITKIVSKAVDNKGKVKTKTTTVKKTITVIQPVASISLNVTSQTIAPKQKLKLTAAVAPATASNKKLTWKSSNPKVAAVSSSGVVTGKKAGTAVITCIAKDVSKTTVSCTVTVK